MPPPQCPECGRFLATAFAQQITTEAAPCPRCGTVLFLGEGTMPTMPEGAAPVEKSDDDVAELTQPDELEDVPTPPVAVSASRSTVSSAAAQDGQELQTLRGAPEATDASVRPVDLAEDGTSRDPLAGWDVGPSSAPVASGDADPTVLAAGAGAGLLVGMVVGGRGHRGLGALLGAVLGALLARLRG